MCVCCGGGGGGGGTGEKKNRISLGDKNLSYTDKRDLRQLGGGRPKLMTEIVTQEWGPSPGIDTAQKAGRKGTGWERASSCEATSLKA